MRLYTLFIGPPEKESEWSEDGVAGAYRFLNRVHELCARVREQAAPAGSGDGPRDTPLVAPDPPHDRARHATTPRRFHFHTAIAALMEFQRGIAEALDGGRRRRRRPLRAAARTLLQLLHPIAPHLTEEWWQRFGEKGFLVESALAGPTTRSWRRRSASRSWSRSTARCAAGSSVARGASESEAMALLRADERIRPWVEGKEITRTVFVPGPAPEPGRAVSRRTAAALLGALLAAAPRGGGCGYALVGKGSSLPESIQVIQFTTLENRTQRVQPRAALLGGDRPRARLAGPLQGPVGGRRGQRRALRAR